MRRFSLCAWLWLMLSLTYGCSAAYFRWEEYRAKPLEWFASEEGRRVTENMLTYQTDAGGWPKNTDMASQPLPPGRRSQLVPTFDNGATHGQLRFLVLAYRATKEPPTLKAFLRGLDYIFQAQYPNGGFPQIYPLCGGYPDHITYNDGAMVGVLTLLRDVAQQDEFGFVDETRRERARTAYDAGIRCILDTQIVVNGVKTVWCAQHDEKTLEPRGARVYEHPSLSGGESAGIVLLLMDIENPNAEIRQAVVAACDWFQRSALKGIRVERTEDDARAVDDPNAESLWARFYDISTNRPIFSGRDGIIKASFNDIEQERRTGYAWYGTWGKGVLERSRSLHL